MVFVFLLVKASQGKILIIMTNLCIETREY